MTGHRRKEITQDSVTIDLPRSWPQEAMLTYLAMKLKELWPGIMTIVTRQGTDHSAYWYDKGIEILRKTEFTNREMQVTVKY